MTESERAGIRFKDDFVLLGQQGAAKYADCHDACPSADRNQVAYVGAGRVDNRNDLADSLGLPTAEHSKLSDVELIHRAYCRWGEETSSRIFGDWSFAVWEPEERKLFVARDHYGNTALYYYVDHNILAFSTSRKVLLDLKLAPLELDELYLAQVLTSWLAYHGERTIHTTIRRLPPAHTLSVTPNTFATSQYWHLESTPILKLARRDEYASAFREVFDEAVRARLRPPENCAPDSEIAATLSGGLDSSSVAVTAAELLRTECKRLKAFTSVPLSDTSLSDGFCIGNEFPFAEATARFAGNIDLYPVNSEELSPIQAIRRMLQITHEPCHAAGNFFWLLQLNQSAVEHGCSVLLTGQIGNATVSWTGDIFSQPLVFQIQRMGALRWLKERAKRMAPATIHTIYRGWRHQHLDWCRSSAIHPEFARRLRLFEQRLNDPNEMPMRTSLDQRLNFIKPGLLMVGAVHAEMGAAAGLEIRDPTADVRVLEFTYSVPDHVFMDPKTGQNRWLIREAMKGRLPEQVRLNRRLGRQAADRVQRLRNCAGEVDVVLDELAAGPAAHYVDVAYMRQMWHKILGEDTSETFVASGTILTRGIMAGLFVNDFYA